MWAFLETVHSYTCAIVQGIAGSAAKGWSVCRCSLELLLHISGCLSLSIAGRLGTPLSVHVALWRAAYEVRVFHSYKKQYIVGLCLPVVCFAIYCKLQPSTHTMCCSAPEHTDKNSRSWTYFCLLESIDSLFKMNGLPNTTQLNPQKCIVLHCIVV